MQKVVQGQFEVVYNLFEFQEHLFLPTAYVVAKDRDGLLVHVKQKATAQTIGGFGLELDATRIFLFDIVKIGITITDDHRCHQKVFDVS